MTNAGEEMTRMKNRKGRGEGMETERTTMN